MDRSLLDLRVVQLAALAALLAAFATSLPAVRSLASRSPAVPAAEQTRERRAAVPETRPLAERGALAGAAGVPAVVAPKRPAPFTVLRVRAGKTVSLRARPGGAVVARLAAVTEFGSPQTLSVVKERDGWARVVTSALPNGRPAWVALADRAVHASRTRVSLTLDLSRRRLVLKKGDRVLRRMTVGVGRPSSPTPSGRFAVTDKLANRWGPYYGCCIVALSAHQPNLPPGWRGGDRIAIHGTNDAGSIGAASSAGCPHASEADMRALMRRVPLGAPVFVRA